MTGKLYGTLGPACADTDTLRALQRAGMRGVRLNLSHGPLEERAPWLESLRRAETAEGVSCDLLIDLQGPELRVGALFAPLAFLIICAALVFAMSVFFRVSRITVTGNALYTEEEITTAAGIEKGDNLFFINRFSAIARIRARLPYIETVSIERALPNRVTITVSESRAIAYVTAETGCWVIDRAASC